MLQGSKGGHAISVYLLAQQPGRRYRPLHTHIPAVCKGGARPAPSRFTTE
jgi:hypothetical protein